jgi:ATP-dependent Clp protease ATP-binding subunit ClpC
VNKLNPRSLRAKKARLSLHIGKWSFETLVLLVWVFGAAGIYFLLRGDGNIRLAYIFLGLTLLVFMVAVWDKWDLSNLGPTKDAKSLDGILESRLLARLGKKADVSAHDAWEAAMREWQGRFLASHLLINANEISEILSKNAADMPAVWQKSQELMSANNSKEIHAGILAAAFLTISPGTKEHLARLNLKTEDVLEVCNWLQRLNSFMKLKNPYFGGIGRDWAAGFTPTLDRFGINISRQIETEGGHFHTLAHADILDPVVHNLSQPSGSVGLVGEVGSGKTSLVYALAQRLLEGRDENLKYYQVVNLDASVIMSESKDQLERVILTLFAEASHARNIIIFLDDAQLFFGKGTGAFDISQVLLPLLQNRSIRLIAAFTPGDFQRLKANNSELVSHLPAVVVNEPEENVTMDIAEDAALILEGRNNIIVSYQAVKEAYKLSGQYAQDIAYPGKAIDLLGQALPYVNGKFMVAESVQQAIEKTHGVKVSRADAPEADTLLHLEDKIHTRMINQERAVKVVANALRRGRAGVSDPKRPIGSFLFLGPTGVGKTELARSLAATYFGDEHQMIRLDMSEYQQASDVERLLEAGDNSMSLILKMREQPFSVVLLDEVEKAHPNILNLLLQILDEGQLTDSKGHATSFKNAIIITTSNAGAAEITQKVAAGDSLESFERPLVDELINKGLFKPELINRFDEVVLFRPLNKQELAKVAGLMLAEVNKTLSNQNISVQLTEAALEKVVDAGYDPQFGARPMRRALQKMVEDAVAKKVLAGQAQAGTAITLDVQDLSG